MLVVINIPIGRDLVVHYFYSIYLSKWPENPDIPKAKALLEDNRDYYLHSMDKEFMPLIIWHYFLDSSNVHIYTLHKLGAN